MIASARDWRRSSAVLAQRDQITRVLVNLISNGIKFTPRSGTVRISIGQAEMPEHPAVRFSISDTGIGIAAKDQERFFREGVRLDSSADPREWSGIGLALSKRVVKEHSGNLHLQSARPR